MNNLGTQASPGIIHRTKHKIIRSRKSKTDKTMQLPREKWRNDKHRCTQKTKASYMYITLYEWTFLYPIEGRQSRFGHQHYCKNNPFMIDLWCSTGHNSKLKRLAKWTSPENQTQVFASFPLIVFFFIVFFNLLFFFGKQKS